jgi:hypothetical protein
MKYKVASDKVIGKVLDDEAVIINLATGIYYGLDGVAARVWDYISQGVSRGSVTQELLLRYPDHPESERELTQLLQQMCEAGLLIEDEGGADAGASMIEWPADYLPLEMVCYDDVAEMVALDPPLPELSHEMLDQPRTSRA